VGVPQASGSGSPVGDPRRIRVEVLAYAPTVFTHCQHCEVAFGQVGVAEGLRRDQARESLPPDLREEFAALGDWVHRLLERHGRRVDVRVIDAASIQGFWKSIRHRARTYPAVVVDGRDRFAGDELPIAEIEIERRVAASPA
jgi:hypothetical protein